MKMRDRGKFPPGGWRYYQPETNWFPTPWSSFDSCVAQIIAHRNGNAWLVSRNGWSTDPNAVADELDQYNAKICNEMGWTQYTGEGGPDPGVPFTLARQKRAVQLAAGAKPMLKWSINGSVVDEMLAAKRAAVCVGCPKNVKKKLFDYFTDAAAALIQSELEIRNGRKLSTPSDSELGICDACGCPLHLKVHCPIEFIANELPTNVRAELDPRCWIPAEITAS